jgi:hypothetical protein
MFDIVYCELLRSATVNTETALVNAPGKTCYIQAVLNIVANFCEELLKKVLHRAWS